MSSACPNPAGALAPRSPSPSPRAHAELLSEDTRAVWSPRLSPDRCRIVYLENDALGPHQQCSRLRMVSGIGGDTGEVAGCPCRGRRAVVPSPRAAAGAGGLRPCKTHPVPCLPQYDWYTKHTSTVLEAVPRQAWGEYSPGGGSGGQEGVLRTVAFIAGAFPGIYCGALPGLCWAADSRRLVLDTAQRSQQVRAAVLGWRRGAHGGPGRVKAPLDSALVPLGRVRGGHGDGHHNLADGR